jgi:hypothetical protein
MDDATSTIYSAFLVEEEGTASTFQALLEVFAACGLPSSLYTDRGSHYFYTARADEAVDRERLTQVGRALDRLVSSTLQPIRRRRGALHPGYAPSTHAHSRSPCRSLYRSATYSP